MMIRTKMIIKDVDLIADLLFKDGTVQRSLDFLIHLVFLSVGMV